jgi:hypothetical protein
LPAFRSKKYFFSLVLFLQELFPAERSGLRETGKKLVGDRRSGMDLVGEWCVGNNLHFFINRFDRLQNTAGYK